MLFRTYLIVFLKEIFVLILDIISCFITFKVIISENWIYFGTFSAKYKFKEIIQLFMTLFLTYFQKVMNGCLHFREQKYINSWKQSIHWMDWKPNIYFESFMNIKNFNFLILHTINENVEYLCSFMCILLVGFFVWILKTNNIYFDGF